MGAYLGGHVGFGLAAVFTHAVLGYTLGALLFDRPRAGLLAGIIPDCDHLLAHLLGSPFVHRGVTHSVLAVGVVAAIGMHSGDRVAGAAGVGYLSHVLLDATTPMGVMLAYPVSTAPLGVVFHGHAPRATVLIWVCCLGALWYRQTQLFYDLDGVDT